MLAIQEIKKEIKAYSKYLLKSKKRCREFLIKTGIFDKYGHYTEPYAHLINKKLGD